MYESCNIEICKKLSQITFKQYLDLVGNEPIIDQSEFTKKDTPSSQYKMMVDYCKKQIKNKFKIKQEYSFGKSNNNGRQFCKDHSLQYLNKKIRGVLSHNILNDYDIVNAQPSLLYNYCITNNVHCPSLEKYVKDRDYVLNEFMKTDNIDRDTAKNLIIKAMNREYCNNKYNKKELKYHFFKELDTEFNSIQKQIIKLNDKIYQECKKKKNFNIGGRVLSRFLQIQENNCLELVLGKYNASVLMFDGFMSEEDIDILDLNKITDKYNVKWTKKDNNIDILDDLLELNIDNNLLSFCGETIKEVSEFLLEMKFKKLFKVYECFYFHNGNIWINNEKEIKRLLKQNIMNCDLWIEGEKAPIPVNSNVKGVNDTLEFIWNMIPIKDDLLENIWNSSLNKIYFQNGYWDFKDNKFKNDIRDTLKYIKKDFDPTSNPIIRKQIYEKILNPIFSNRDNLRDCFLYDISRCLGGDIERKKWFCLEGLRNCGKGVLCDLIIKSFERYISTTNSENFVYKPSNGDSQKAMSYLMDFEWTRLVLTQEISLKDEGKTYLDGNKIKKFTSGGDSLSARKNFQDEREFKIQSSLMICCNDLPEIKPSDAKDFLHHYIMKSKFIDKDEEKKYETIDYYEKDPNIKNGFLNNPKVHNEFILLITEFFNKPSKFPKEYIEIDEEEDDSFRLIECFEFTGNQKDYIQNKDLKMILNREKLHFTSLKAKRILKMKGAKEFRTDKLRGLNCIKEKSTDFFENDDED